MSTTPATLDIESVGYYLEGFLLHHRAQRRAPATLTFYQRYVQAFITYLADTYHVTALTDVTANHLRAFLVLQQEKPGRYTQGAGLRPRAIHAYARALRAFWMWATVEARLETNPFANVAMPAVPNEWEVVTYSEADIVALFKACEEASTPYLRARDRALLAVLLSSAIRAGELLKMQLGDLDTQRWVFEVQGKGEKKRQAFLDTFGRRELRAYLVQRLRQDIPTQRLWVSQQGQPLSYWGLKEVFHRLKMRSGITIHGGAHICRHTAATRMNNDHMNPVFLQALMGHAQFDTTRKYYLKVTGGDLEREMAEHGALDSMANQIRHGKEPSTGGRERARHLPEPKVLLKEVRARGYRETAREYGVSDTTIRNTLRKAGLI